MTNLRASSSFCHKNAKANNLKKRTTDEQNANKRNDAISQVEEAASSTRSDVAAGGSSLGANLKSTLVFPGWSSILHFQWLPPALDFVKARLSRAGDWC